VFGACSRYAPGNNFPAFRQEAFERFGVFVIYNKAAVRAKAAVFSPVKYFFPHGFSRT
jgi:hypothetical protein